MFLLFLDLSKLLFLFFVLSFNILICKTVISLDDLGYPFCSKSFGFHDPPLQETDIKKQEQRMRFPLNIQNLLVHVQGSLTKDILIQLIRNIRMAI